MPQSFGLVWSAPTDFWLNKSCKRGDPFDVSRALRPTISGRAISDFPVRADAEAFLDQHREALARNGGGSLPLIATIDRPARPISSTAPLQ